MNLLRRACDDLAHGCYRQAVAAARDEHRAASEHAAAVARFRVEWWTMWGDLLWRGDT